MIRGVVCRVILLTVIKHEAKRSAEQFSDIANVHLKSSTLPGFSLAGYDMVHLDKTKIIATKVSGYCE